MNEFLYYAITVLDSWQIYGKILASAFLRLLQEAKNRIR